MRRKFKRLTAFLLSAAIVFPFFGEYPSGTFDFDWGITVSAADAATAGGFTITLTEGGGDPVVDTDYTYADYAYAPGVLTIKSSAAMTISGTTTTDRIVVADGVSANITLNGVNIDTSNASGAAFMIADNSTGNVTITLADGTTNTLKSGDNCAGLQKNGEYSETLGKLTITGTGSLTATGGGYGAGTGGDFGGAGIGGGKNGSGSNIEISGGTVTATGGYRAAGIGGGGGGSSSNIEISGGTVTATGGSGGAGIGGSWLYSGSDIKISGGVVTATGGEYGAGIGGGFEANGSNITISGGVVIANGGAGSNGGAGIGGGGSGGGSYGSGSNITINGGTVTATGSSNGAGIGGGGGGSSSNIEISGGTVKADTIGCTPTDGIGNNVYLLELTSATSSLKIDGKDFPINHGSDGKVYVYLPAGDHTIVKDGGAGTTAYYAKNADNKLEAVAIGTAFTITGTDLVYGTDYTYANGVLTIKSSAAMTISGTTTTDRIEVADDVSANITLAGVNIDVSSQSNTAAFKIADNSAGNVTITLADGTTNTLKSGNNCAGLQKNGEYSETLGKLTITGTGSLTATGGESGAGIGGGYNGNSSNIEISGGKVTATGGEYGAGIGGGDSDSGGDGCDGSYITISGGEVTATGGNSGAGIGGGFEGNGSNITISGGEVTATGGEYGAGIGGGFEGNGSDIEISGGKVTATGGDDGAGIGSGDSGSGSYITISGGEVTATGGEEAAGIGGGWNGNGSNIEISGGKVTATGGKKAAGIGGGFKGNGSNIEISGGSVKAVAGEKYEYDGTTYFPAAIGHGVQYDGNTGVYSNGAEVTPTDGNDNVYLTDNVYLLELDVDGTSAVTINGKAYPTKHIDENKLYVYLPAKTAQAPNEVTVGNETTKYCYINAKWLKVVDSPEADDTEFTYDGTEKIYTFAGSDYCTITGNKQTNAGTYTVTVALNDKVNTVWSDDGTTDDKTYEFVINKATPTAKMFTYTAPTDLDYDGNVKSATVTTDKDGMGDITIQYYKNGILTEPVECGIYSVKVSVAEGDNYTDATDLTADDWTFTINHVDADNNGYCDDCGAICDGIGAHLAGYTLSLNGSIGVNFHMDLTQDVLDDNEAYMLFTLPNGTTQKVMVSDAKAKEPAVIEGKTYYIFTCNVAAKEMTDTIQAQLITSDGSKTQVYEYSVREYANRILSGSYDDETIELVKAMLHYGAYSQEWFDYNTTNLANAELDTLDLSEADNWDLFDPIITNDEKVGSFTSAYLTLESDTAINLKFKLADGVSFEDLTFVVEDTLRNVVPVTIDTTENVCLITLTGIKASDLDTMYDFSVTDKEGNESAILYSAMSYARAVANSEMDQKLKNVTAALRIFNLRADAKFE